MNQRWLCPYPASGYTLCPRLPGNWGYHSHCDRILSVRPHRVWQGAATHRHVGQEMASPLIYHMTLVFISLGLSVLCYKMGGGLTR